MRTLLLVILGLLGSSLPALAADSDSGAPAIDWLDVTQTSPPSKVSELRTRLMKLIEPLRREVLGPLKQVSVAAHFATMPAAEMKLIAPQSTGSTNADGTIAWLLSPAQIQSLNKRLNTSTNVDWISAPRVLTLEE